MLLNCGVGADSWESLHCKEIQPVHPKEDQSWVFIGRTDAKAETPVLWPPHAKSWLIGKDSDAGRDWGQEKKGTTEDEMAGWHHWLDGHEFEWTLGVGDGQGGLVCCNSWGRIESDMTEQLNWTVLILYLSIIKLTWIENIHEYKLTIIYSIFCATLGQNLCYSVQAVRYTLSAISPALQDEYYYYYFSERLVYLPIEEVSSSICLISLKSLPFLNFKWIK